MEDELWCQRSALISLMNNAMVMCYVHLRQTLQVRPGRVSGQADDGGLRGGVSG